MTITVKPETFATVSSEQNERLGLIEHGTVEITINGQTLKADAQRYANVGDIYIKGFVGRYRTGAKAWRATVAYRPGQRGLYAHFGRDDRSGRFQKISMISYQPEIYAAL